MRSHVKRTLVIGVFCALGGAILTMADSSQIGREVAIQKHLADGQEITMPTHQLIDFGRKLFTANWTIQEGGGRPLTKGTGNPLTDQNNPLLFPRNFNRVSAPDSNSCAGCHNAPFGTPGGGGDIVGNVFVLGQRFDFANFDGNIAGNTVSSRDETGALTDLDRAADSRATIGMFGSGYIEMLARQITADLQAIRDSIPPGGAKALVSSGLSFGTLKRGADGTWDTSAVEGLAAPSLATAGTANPPSLIIRPFHQAGNVISIRQFTNNALNHHHGMQSEERFGKDVDADGDGFVNEITRADVTALSIYQATLPLPGRVMPRDRDVEQAVLLGEKTFAEIGCAGCHVPALPLRGDNRIYTEPNPYNPAGNLRPVDGVAPVKVNLNHPLLPGPRLEMVNGVTVIPAYTDLKLHDITSGPDDPNREALDMQEAVGSAAFFAGNGKFITKKLWGAANEPPFFHHGKYTTLRQAVVAHAGEAQAVTDRYNALTAREQDALIEFLKTLQVLPPGTRSLIVDENYKPRNWPPNR